MKLHLAACAAALSIVAACGAETIEGRANITDGDSFEIGATRVRLHAIDAPEGRQPCTRGGGAWRCGDAAAAKLEALTRGRDVSCAPRDVDDYGRIVAVCYADGLDLGAEMVRAGLALAYRRFGDDYVREESDARAARRGVWAGEITPPWEWRAEQRGAAGARTAAPPPSPAPDSGAARGGPGCAIKGNINAKGERIYHVPGSRSYAETIIDERKGERMFCSREEAERAGWRAPRR